MVFPVIPRVWNRAERPWESVNLLFKPLIVSLVGGKFDEFSTHLGRWKGLPERPLKWPYRAFERRDSQLYYLQSRYYDPTIGRFINADRYVSTGDRVLGHNMFVGYVCGLTYDECRILEQLGMAYFHSVRRGDSHYNQIRGVSLKKWCCLRRLHLTSLTAVFTRKMVYSR